MSRLIMRSHYYTWLFASLAALLLAGCGGWVGSAIANDILETNGPITPLRRPNMQKRRHTAVEITKPDAVIPPASPTSVPVLSRLETKQPVVFLTIDDGQEKGGDFARYLETHHLKASLFLTRAFVAQKDAPYFQSFVKQGGRVEDHTLSHNLQFYKQSLAYQQQEICGMADAIAQDYGARPYLFRPPGGAYTTVTQQAAARCGMRAIIHWHATVNGGAMHYQDGDGLRAGDIVLMHFRPMFKADIDAFATELDRQKLHTELLEDWIQP